MNPSRPWWKLTIYWLVWLHNSCISGDAHLSKSLFRRLSARSRWAASAGGGGRRSSRQACRSSPSSASRRRSPSPKIKLTLEILHRRAKGDELTCAATPLHVDLLRVWGRLVCRGWYWVLFVGDVSPSSSVPLHAPHKKKRNEGWTEVALDKQTIPYLCSDLVSEHIVSACQTLSVGKCLIFLFYPSCGGVISNIWAPSTPIA